MTRWVVAEVEHRIGFIGGTEREVIKSLGDKGFETFWMHYRDVWARPRLPNGKRTTKPGKVKEVLRGYFAPFLFVAVPDGSTKVVSGAVGEIRATKFIADVLWSEDNPLYLQPSFIPWAKSVRIDPKTGINQDPVPIDPEAGLFEPPPDRGPHRAAAMFRPGDKVSTFDKWRAFDSVVKSIDATGKVIVSHFQAWGAEGTMAYDPEHLVKR